MRKVLLLWPLFCFLTLSACCTVVTNLKTNPVTCRLTGTCGPLVNLSADLRCLSGTQVEKQKGGISITIPSDLLFQPDADRVKLSNMSDMDVLVNAGKKYPQMNIEVSVYTDSTHSEEQNLALSELEAWLIKRALVDSGISPHRVSAQGWGESRPVASNATADGRKANRRVRITFGQKKS